MTLGELLARAGGAAAALSPPLLDEIAATGFAPDEYARLAVAQFEREAGAEDWAHVISRVQAAADPATACLDAMVRFALVHDPGRNAQ